MIEVETVTCPHCKHTSTATDPVIWRNVYVGGHGYVAKLMCRDVISCWSRWDAAHDWPPLAELARRQEMQIGNS